MRNTFHGIVAGSGRFLDASLLALLYIVPYAVWGQNLFGGLLYSCNDGGAGISSRVDCVGEFAASPSQWTFLAPRVWQNPTEGSQYSFDDFRSALLILFEIVSLEGWVDVMTAAMAIVGRDMQASPDATQVNALFFVIYNLIGAVCGFACGAQCQTRSLTPACSRPHALRLRPARAVPRLLGRRVPDHRAAAVGRSAAAHRPSAALEAA
jgi:hypothetical protein